jgi:hypothetical protein
MWLTGQLPSSYMPPSTGALFIPLTILGPWIAMANLGTIGLSGRGAKILFPLVTFCVGYCVAMGIVRHFTSDLVAQQVHTVCTTIAATFLVVASMWLYAQAQKKKHIKTATSIIAAISCVALVLVAILLRPRDMPFLYYPTVIIFAILVIAPIASMPLAIAWNRNR